MMKRLLKGVACTVNSRWGTIEAIIISSKFETVSGSREMQAYLYTFAAAGRRRLMRRGGDMVFPVKGIKSCRAVGPGVPQQIKRRFWLDDVQPNGGAFAS